MPRRLSRRQLRHLMHESLNEDQRNDRWFVGDRGGRFLDLHKSSGKWVPNPLDATSFDSRDRIERVIDSYRKRGDTDIDELSPIRVRLSYEIMNEAVQKRPRMVYNEVMSTSTTLVYDSESREKHGEMPPEAVEDVLSWDDGYEYEAVFYPDLEGWEGRMGHWGIDATDVPSDPAYWVPEENNWVDEGHFL